MLNLTIYLFKMIISPCMQLSAEYVRYMRSMTKWLDSQDDFKEFDCISLHMIFKKIEMLVEFLENNHPDGQSLATYPEECMNSVVFLDIKKSFHTIDHQMY